MTDTKPCCTPSKTDTKLGTNSLSVPLGKKGQRRLPTEVAEIPGGRGWRGTAQEMHLGDGEGPFKQIKLKPFLMSPWAVTNAEFKDFVDATGHKTEAEDFDWSFVLFSQLDEDSQTQGVVGVEWWRQVHGATWLNPLGPGSHERAWNPDDPVVHVSWNDAKAYAAWVGGRLPTENEWEHAARGGQGDVKYPWGDLEPNDTDTFPCNIWQGSFPHENSAKDGYITTAPAKSFEPNAYGLYNMSGNVWEWTADPYTVKSLRKEIKERLKQMRGFKLSKGGSFMCHKSYCYRYRIAARSGTSPDTTAQHQGFRVVWDIETKL